MSRRRRRPKHPPEALTVSATDADWAVVRDNAERRGVSISRYVVALVLGGWDAPDGPALALTGDEQREMLETVRSFRALMADGADESSLIENLRTRVAVLLDAWAVRMSSEGRLMEHRTILAARIGAEETDRFVARIEALGAPGKAPSEGKSGRDSNGPSGQGSLFC